MGIWGGDEGVMGGLGGDGLGRVGLIADFWMMVGWMIVWRLVVG